MRNVLFFVLACTAGLVGWLAFASWHWGRLDFEALFRDRIAREASANTVVKFVPGTILVGSLSDTARLICGSALVGDPAGTSQQHLYSIVVVKTLFGYAINDGYTPKARPENKSVSDQNCALLSNHAASSK